MRVRVRVRVCFAVMQADARHAFVGVPPCLMTDAIATGDAVVRADSAILDFLESDGQRFGPHTRLTTAAASVAASSAAAAKGHAGK